MELRTRFALASPLPLASLASLQDAFDLGRNPRVPTGDRKLNSWADVYRYFVSFQIIWGEFFRAI